MFHQSWPQISRSTVQSYPTITPLWLSSHLLPSHDFPVSGCNFPVIPYPPMTFQSVGDSNENFWLYAPHFCRNSSYWVAWSAAKTCWWSMASWWSWAFFPVHEMQNLVSAIMHESSTILAATPIYWGIRALCCSNWSEAHLPPICEYNRHIPALPALLAKILVENQGFDCTPTSFSNNQCL